MNNFAKGTTFIIIESQKENTMNKPKSTFERSISVPKQK